MLTAKELHARGLELSNAARHASARQVFNRALERVGDDDPDTRARIELSLAHVVSELGSADEGVARCSNALAIDGVSRQVRGLIHSQLGLLHMRAGAATKALPEFADAIRLLDESPEPLATAYLNRGNLFLFRGDIAAAASDLERSATYADQAGHAVLAAKALHNLGYAQMMAGDLVSALTMMDAARPELDGLSPVLVALCEQERAEVLTAAGMTQEAAEVLQNSARVFGSRRMRQRQAEAEVALARLLMLDDPRAASKVARRAQRRFATRGSEVWATRAESIAMSGELADKRRGPLPLDRVDELVSQLRGQGVARESADLSLRVALALGKAGETDSAAQYLRRAHVAEQSPLASRLLAREVRATMARRRGRRADAVAHLRRGLADLHEWQSSFGSLEMQSSLVGHGRSLALQGLGMAIEDGRPKVVFEWSERARALASRVTPLRPPVNDEAAEELTELRQLQNEIADAESRGVVPKALLAHANRLRNQIRQRAWYGAGSGVVVEPAEVAAIVSELGSTEGAVLSYLVVDEQAYCLVVTANQPEMVALGAFSEVRTYLDGMQADLDMSAAELPAAMATAVRSALDRRLVKLAEILVKPVENRIGDGSLVIVPSATLAGVPWTLLDGLVGRPITIPRSATAWLGDRATPFALESAGFVAGPRVPRAVEEVERASASWNAAEILEGDGALSRPVRHLASEVDVFHAAAHGRHSADNPLFSGLELADGPWFGYDIDQLGAIPTTVVLSACEVGRSSVRWGEETIGMTVAWLHAGARCVIASPALVNDNVACDVLAETHKRLAAGVAPSYALAAAAADVGGDALVPFTVFGSGW